MRYIPTSSSAMLLCCIALGLPAYAAKTDQEISARVDKKQAELEQAEQVQTKLQEFRQLPPEQQKEQLQNRCVELGGKCHFKVDKEAGELQQPQEKIVAAYKENCNPLTSVLTLSSREAQVEETETIETMAASANIGVFMSFLGAGVSVENSKTTRRSMTRIKESMKGVEEPVMSGGVVIVTLNVKTRKITGHYEFDEPFHGQREWKDISIEMGVPVTSSKSPWKARFRCLKPEERTAFCEKGDEPTQWTNNPEDAFNDRKDVPARCTLDGGTEAVEDQQEAEADEAVSASEEVTTEEEEVGAEVEKVEDAPLEEEEGVALTEGAAVSVDAEAAAARPVRNSPGVSTKKRRPSAR